MEIQIVKFFQNWACGFCDVFFWLITKMGEANFFLMLLAVVYLCYSDKFALKLTFYYLCSVAFNNIVKLICKRPRPYVASLDIKDRLHAGGYSFPSGHTQGYCVLATSVFLETNEKAKKKWVKWTFMSSLIFLGLLVMISRMYWGQHYLSDVLVGMMFGVSIPFFLNFLIELVPKKIKSFVTFDLIYKAFGCISFIVALCTILLDFLGGIVVSLLYNFSAVFIVLTIGYFVNKKKIKYIANQGFSIGVIKAVVIIGVIIGLYCLFDSLFVIKGIIGFFVYLCLGLICTIILPIVFKYVFRKGYQDERIDN